MGYLNSVYRRADEELQRRRYRAESVVAERKATICAANEEYARLANELSKTGMAIVKTAFGENHQERLNRLCAKNVSIQEKMNAELKKMGIEKDYISAHYVCEKCNDFGFINEKECDCYKKLTADIAKKDLNCIAPAEKCRFDNFDLSYYKDFKDEDGEEIYSSMKDILVFAQKYSDDFSSRSRSLFMFGRTGLGKTHLTLAIANRVIEKGYGVIYSSVQNIISGLENAHFGRENNFYSEKIILKCDLLIIDDLGCEFTNNFAISEIYNIINTRLLSGKPTIISSNLAINEVEKKYTERVASRIFGEFLPIHFMGKDIRTSTNFK